MSHRPMIPASVPLPHPPAQGGRAPAESSETAGRGLAWPIAMTCVAVLLLYVRSWAAPVVFADDFPILAQSRTWERTRAGLWLPQNEHAMPLGRLFSFALECLAGRLPALPFVLSWVGP